MNYRNIAPVGFWSPEGEKEAVRIMLYNFHNYNFNGSDSYVSYKLQMEDEVSLHEGSVAIPDTIVQAWGEDDEPIFDYVISQLGLTKITE